ncbi:hypothetical protein Tco_0844433 [Tanacetum coccineum]
MNRNSHVLERLDTSAGNPVKEILLKLNLPDHRILKDGGEDAETRLCLVDDLKVFKESHSRQDEEQAQDLTSMITTSIHKIEVYKLKTKDKAC